MDVLGKTAPKLTIYAHANRGIGHVWFSLTEESGKAQHYEISPDCKSFYKQFDEAKNRTRNFEGIAGKASFLKVALEGIFHQIRFFIEERSFTFEQSLPEKKGREHDVKIDIDLTSQQVTKIKEGIAQYLEHSNNRYQIIGTRFNPSKENCVSNIRGILASAGIDLEDYLPSGTWIERINSPASIVLRSLHEHRSGNPNVSVADRILEKGPPTTFIYRLTAALDSLSADYIPGRK